MSVREFTKKPFSLVILWGLILEFPIRYLISPDPWIHGSEHWYFTQPDRLIIEILFAFLAILPFFWVKELKALLSFRWKENKTYLIYGLIGAVTIFLLQQWDEVTTVSSNNLERFVPIWFLTGLSVGIGQELTFRGLIYTGVFKKYGMKAAVVVSTLCFVFGSIHSPRMYKYFVNDYIFEAFLLLFIFLASGLFFVWLRIKTKSVLIPAFIHGIGNAITWYSFVIVKLYVG